MSKKQDKLEGMIKEQNNQIGEILSRSQFDSKVEDTKGKGKGKGKVKKKRERESEVNIGGKDDKNDSNCYKDKLKKRKRK